MPRLSTRYISAALIAAVFAATLVVAPQPGVGDQPGPSPSDAGRQQRSGIAPQGTVSNGPGSRVPAAGGPRSGTSGGGGPGSPPSVRGGGGPGSPPGGGPGAVPSCPVPPPPPAPQGVKMPKPWVTCEDTIVKPNADERAPHAATAHALTAMPRPGAVPPVPFPGWTATGELFEPNKPEYGFVVQKGQENARMHLCQVYSDTCRIMYAVANKLLTSEKNVAGIALPLEMFVGTTYIFTLWQAPAFGTVNRPVRDEDEVEMPISAPNAKAVMCGALAGIQKLTKHLVCPKITVHAIELHAGAAANSMVGKIGNLATATAIGAGKPCPAMREFLEEFALGFTTRFKHPVPLVTAEKDAFDAFAKSLSDLYKKAKADNAMTIDKLIQEAGCAAA